MTDQENRTLTVSEPGAVPWLSVVFGYGPMLPFAAGAAAAWWLGGVWGELALSLTTLWGCAILLFLLGFCALVLTTGGATGPALILLIVGFAGIAVLDPIAARRGEAPLFFARLRPLQIPIAILSLCALLALKL